MNKNVITQLLLILVVGHSFMNFREVVAAERCSASVVGEASSMCLGGILVISALSSAAALGGGAAGAPLMAGAGVSALLVVTGAVVNIASRDDVVTESQSSGKTTDSVSSKDRGDPDPENVRNALLLREQIKNTRTSAAEFLETGAADALFDETASSIRHQAVLYANQDPAIRYVAEQATDFELAAAIVSLF